MRKRVIKSSAPADGHSLDVISDSEAVNNCRVNVIQRSSIEHRESIKLTNTAAAPDNNTTAAPDDNITAAPDENTTAQPQSTIPQQREPYQRASVTLTRTNNHGIVFV